MANLLFKRGLHDNLMALKNQSGGIVDGAFYLTEDTHRLYAGIDAGSGTQLVDLNQYILIVNRVADLSDPANRVEPGDFAYIKEGNILAVYRDDDEYTGWRQINAFEDNYVNKIETSNKHYIFDAQGQVISSEVDETLATIATEDEEGNILANSFKFVGTFGTEVKVTQTADDEYPVIEISGCKYDLKSTLTGEEGNKVFTIQLDSNKDDIVPDTNLTLAEGANVTFTEVKTGDKTTGITISAKDTMLVDNQNEESGVTSVHTFAVVEPENEEDGPTGAVEVTIVDTEGNKAIARTANNTFFYDIGDSGLSVNNQGVLPVYTKDQIDKMVSRLNAMVYKGTVGAGGTVLTLPTEKVQYGDTYMVKTSFTFTDVTDNNEVKEANIGDLFVATGTEWTAEDDDSTVENIGTLKTVIWTYIPSGNDAQHDTQYHAIVNTIKHTLSLQDSADNIVHVHTLDGSDKITLESVEIDADGNVVTEAEAGTGVGIKTTIKHAAPGANDPSKEQTLENGIIENQEPEFTKDVGYKVTAIAEQEVDSTGHVASYTKNKLVIPHATLGLELKSETADIATVTHNLKDVNDTELSTDTFTLDASASDNLKLTIDASKKIITVEMKWDTF